MANHAKEVYGIEIVEQAIEDAKENCKINNIKNAYYYAGDTEKLLAKLIYEFEDILVQVTDKNEPSILSRYLIDAAKAYSNFYNENKIISEDKALQNARV